jgi:Protein of unknown function (DUF1203)
MNYRIEGLDPTEFAPLFALSDESLAARNITVERARDENYPCRVSLAGAAIGDRVLLMNYTHLPVDSPYRSSHAIYVAEGSKNKAVYRNEIAPVMRSRMLSVRAFDAHDMIVDAYLVNGHEAESLIIAQLAKAEVSYLHVHFAKRGCFAARVVRD